MSETAAELDQASFPYTIVGHVGDGNFHVLMLLDPDNPQQWAESERINHRLVGARSPWTAPAQANTASACTKWPSCGKSMAKTPWT